MNQVIMTLTLLFHNVPVHFHGLSCRGSLNRSITTTISIGAQLTLGGGTTLFARKCMYEKLIKCTAKTGFEIHSCIPRTHEMKNRILSKNKGCLFFFLPKIDQLPEYYMMFARKIIFLPNLGGNCPPAPPVSYAYDNYFLNSVTYHKHWKSPQINTETDELIFTSHVRRTYISELEHLSFRR